MPDPRTPPIRENPVHTLEIAVTDGKPKDTTLSVELDGRSFAVKTEQGYHWNKKAFSMLSQLFPMSVTATSSQPPLITIGK